MYDIGNYAKYKDKKQIPDENTQKGVIAVPIILMRIKFLHKIANKWMSIA